MCATIQPFECHFKTQRLSRNVPDSKKNKSCELFCITNSLIITHVWACIAVKISLSHLNLYVCPLILGSPLKSYYFLLGDRKKKIHLNLVAIAFSYFGLDPIHNSFSHIYIQFSQFNVLWSFPGDRPWSEGKASQWAVWWEWALHGCLQSDRSFDRMVHICHFNTGFTPNSSLKWIIYICKVTLWPADFNPCWGLISLSVKLIYAFVVLMCCFLCWGGVITLISVCWVMKPLPTAI